MSRQRLHIPALLAGMCGHVTHPQQRRQAAVTCATPASYQEAAYLLFLFPTVTDWKMATNWRRLPGTWEDIYWLTIQSHLRSLGAKRASWSNATISSDLSGRVRTIMWERSKLLDYWNKFVMYLFATVWLVPKLMPSWRLFLKGTYCSLCIHKLWLSEFQGLIHHQEAKSITMISLFQSIEKLLWLAFILLQVGSIKELSLLTLP